MTDLDAVRRSRPGWRWAGAGAAAVVVVVAAVAVWQLDDGDDPAGLLATGDVSAPVELPVDVLPAQAQISIELVDDDFDRPPIAVGATYDRLLAGTDSWGRHDLHIRGAQVEWQPVIALEATTYETAGEQLVPVSGPASRPTLPFGTSVTVDVRVAGREGLGVGLHSYTLAVPVWIEGSRASTTDPDGEVQIVVTYEIPDPAAPPPVFTTASGLECARDLMSEGISEYGLPLEPGAGYGTIEEAAEAYWTADDGAFRDDRDELTQIIEPPTVYYDDAQGHTQLILGYVQIDSRWVLETTEACA